VVVLSGTEFVTSLTVGSQPTGFAFDASDQNIYVNDEGGNSVSVISAENEVMNTISLVPNDTPWSIVYNPVNQDLYVPIGDPPGNSLGEVAIIEPSL
jgi:DNA-binding beta-propeller fold protein YncE